MPEDTTANPQIVPYLYYEDTAAAMKFLADVFGFEERMVMRAPDGTPMHVEMGMANGGLVMLGTPSAEYRNPKRLGQPTQGLYVLVDDVDADFEHANTAGANITEGLKDQPYGDRNYAAEDPEGHQWFFGQHIRDVSVEEVERAYADMGSTEQ